MAWRVPLPASVACSEQPTCRIVQMVRRPPNDSLDGAVAAHILPYPSIGGTEYGTLRIMKAVESAGVRNIAMNLHLMKPLKRLFEDSGFPVIEWPAPEPSIRHGKAFWQASRALAREFRRLNVSLVHCSDYLAAHHTALAGYLAGVPVLCHIRNRHSEMSFRDRIFLLPVTRFAFVSRDTWNQFAFPVSAQKGSVLYDGIGVPSEAEVASGKALAPAIKAEFHLPESSRLIGMVARVAPQKDFDTLVRAAAIVIAAHPDVRFLIIGDNSMTQVARDHYQHVRQLLDSHGLADHFTFTGYRSDTLRLIGGVEIAVLSTHQEGLPLALIETMAFAVPTIATEVDGVPELIEDAKTGFLCPHQDAGNLAEKIILLLDDPVRAAAMGLAARQRILNTFTLENFADGIADIYRLMLTGRSGGSAV